MELLQTLQELKDRIRNSETEEALAKLSVLLSDVDPDLVDEAYALQQQMNMCQQQSRLNLIDYKEYSIAFSNISYSTLRLITVASKTLQARQTAAVPAAGLSLTDSGAPQPVASAGAGEAPDLLQTGYSKMQSGDYAGAMSDLTAFAEHHPNSWEAKQYLAELYENLGLWDEALHWYTTAIQLNPKLAQALNNRGNIRMAQQSDYERAYNDFNAALVADPALLTARFNRALAAMHQGAYAQAVEDLDMCIQQHFQGDTASGLRGVCRVHTGDYAGSMADLKTALKADPENASYWGSYGLCQYHLGQYPAAIETLTRALELDPGQPEMQTVRGIAYYFQDDYTPAEADFREAVRQAPQYAYGWYFLGLVAKSQGEARKAVEYLSEACKQNPDLAEAYAILGVIAFENEQYAEAVQFCERALQSDPEQTTALEFLEKARNAKKGGLWNKLFGA